MCNKRDNVKPTLNIVYLRTKENHNYAKEVLLNRSFSNRQGQENM